MHAVGGGGVGANGVSLPVPSVPFLSDSAKASLLEKRLLGLDTVGGDQSADGSQISSSTVGFKETGGRMTFEHFQNHATNNGGAFTPPNAMTSPMKDTAIAPSAPFSNDRSPARVAPVPPFSSSQSPLNRRGGSISPLPIAQHGGLSQTVDSQAQTRVIDQDAAPPSPTNLTLTGGLVAGLAASNPQQAAAISAAATAASQANQTSTMTSPPKSTRATGGGTKRKAASPSPRARKKTVDGSKGSGRGLKRQPSIAGGVAVGTSPVDEKSPAGSPQKPRAKTSLTETFAQTQTHHQQQQHQQQMNEQAQRQRVATPPPHTTPNSAASSPIRSSSTQSRKLAAPPSPQRPTSTTTASASVPSSSPAFASTQAASASSTITTPAPAHSIPKSMNITSYFTGGSSFVNAGRQHTNTPSAINATPNGADNTEADPSTPHSHAHASGASVGSDSDNEVMIIDSSSQPHSQPDPSTGSSSTSTPPNSTASKKDKYNKGKGKTSGGSGPDGKTKHKKKDSINPSPNTPLSSTSPSDAAASPSFPSSASNAATAASQQRLREWEAQLAQRAQALDDRERELETRQRDQQLTQEHLIDLSTKCAQAETALSEYQNRVSTLLTDVFRELYELRQRIRDEQLLRDSLRIGQLVPSRDMGQGLPMHAGFQEEWQDGEAIKDIKSKLELLQKEREEVEAQKKKITRKRLSIQRANKKESNNSSHDSSAVASSAAAAAAAASSSTDMDDDDEKDGSGFKKPAPLDLHSLFEQEEICNVRLSTMKKHLSELESQANELDQAKKSLIRTSKLAMDARNSRFNHRPVLNTRYVILELLGKGGFSEVYKAFDLQELRYVACKIHQLNPNWSDSKKMNYTRHATREYKIHKALQHQRVVQLYDVFAIDVNAFATVLEHCDGSDLDMYLKLRHTLSEREARCIIHQVFSGLKYLNEQRQKIIHYDLKPANILFHQGEVKLTDFGLSKLTPEGATDGIDLTSQGSGTYWYLPPECFASDAKISSKVDVWSAGIVLYQMLVGRKPFGHGLSPDAILSQRTIAEARHVSFPHNCKISKESQEFIRRCLDYRPECRPDILAILDDQYFKATLK